MPEQHPSTKAITSGPKHHWFAYYDKIQFDPTSRYALGMEVDFSGRSPTPDDTAHIGMIDLHRNDQWIELAESRAWCWQQGCMLQWRPGSRHEILWNDREDNRFICRILDITNRTVRTVPSPVYAVSPDGTTAVTTDFRRINHMRPGYGYPGIPDPFQDTLAPQDSGIWLVNLDTGYYTLIISIADIAAIPYSRGDFSTSMHYFNHLLFNTDGSRFIFLHRWRVGQSGWLTRMMTASPDGTNIHVVDDYGETSHFIWRDPEHVLAWAQRPSQGWSFYLYRDRTDSVQPIGSGVMTENGHCSFLPGTQWILNDTYPDNDRVQHLYLYNVPANRTFALGSFRAPHKYAGEWRCDLHPRSNSDGTLVSIDSAHTGTRQIYMFDISEFLARS